MTPRTLAIIALFCAGVAIQALITDPPGPNLGGALVGFAAALIWTRR